MADMKRVKEMEEKSLDIRLKLLKLCEQTLIHIGGDLSVADIIERPRIGSDFILPGYEGLFLKYASVCIPAT